MSTSELEGLELDAAVTTKLQAIIGSDQVDDDTITEKLAEFYGGKPPVIIPASATFLEGKKIEVDAIRVGKFKGKWDKDVKAGPSGGKLIHRQGHKLKGRYLIRPVTLNQNLTLIVFWKRRRADPKAADEDEEAEEPEDYDEELHRPRVPDAVFRGKGIVPSAIAPGKGHGRWNVYV